MSYVEQVTATQPPAFIAPHAVVPADQFPCLSLWRQLIGEIRGGSGQNNKLLAWLSDKRPQLFALSSDPEPVDPSLSHH